MSEAYGPVTEIRECHNRMFSDAQHLAEYFQRRARFLESLAEDHIVERLIGQIRERLFNIAMENRHAAADRLAHFRARDFDPPRVYVFLLGEPRQQLSLAAAQIQNARVGFND